MIRSLPFATLLCSLLLAACASAGPTAPAACDGRHRRPANPHGSVLQNVPAPLADASTPAVRLAAGDLSFQPCRGRP